MKKIYLIPIILALAIIGFIAYSIISSSVFIDNKPAAASNIKDATYVIDGQLITLVNGEAEITIPKSASKQIFRYFGNEAAGDLNADGKSDTAFLLTEDNGGSGTFFYVAVALAKDNGYQGTNAIFLGDRIAPQATQIENGKVVVNYADRNPGEPFTVRPSLGVSRYFQAVDNKLVEIK